MCIDGSFVNAILTSKGDSNWNLLKQLIDSYGTDETLKRSKTSSSIDIKLIDEWAVCDEVKSIQDATEIYKVTYTKFDTKHHGHNGYITITEIK